jgi:hypothetical protein
MAGLFPAIHLPETASFDGEKGVDYRSSPVMMIISYAFSKSAAALCNWASRSFAPTIRG